MYQKLFAVICIFSLIFCGCSKENKFGIEQFVNRLNSQYEYTVSTADFILGTKENKNTLFCEAENNLIFVSLDEKNNIIGVGFLSTSPDEIENTLLSFCKISSVLTDNDYIDQYAILTKCEISVDKIKFADDSFVATIGKYKYTVVCNEYSITLFCDKI